jgi:hypothetical protein
MLAARASIRSVKRVMIQADAVLLERARHAARERGVSFPQLVRDALERELSETGPQPPLASIGMFESGRGDLSARASSEEYEPEPFR